MQEINWDDFEKVKLCVGTILEAEDLPKARVPAYKLTIHFGPEIGIKQSSAQITDLYDKAGLIGTKIIGVVNFPPKRIVGFKSEVLVTGFKDDLGRIVLARPDGDAPNGRMLM
jgi:tRNA-binding protein